MALLRVREKTRPLDASKDRPLGECHGETMPYRPMRLTIDEAIDHAARFGHQIGRKLR